MLTQSSLIGRTHELELLKHMLGASRDGRIGSSFITGEAGIGKTRLAAEAIEAARASGFGIFRALGAELEQDRPFGMIADALEIGPGGDERRIRIWELLTGRHDPADPGFSPLPDLRFRILDEVVDLVVAEAQARPHALILEDLHWGDRATFLTIDRLLRLDDHSAPLAIVMTYRPVPRAPDLIGVVEAARANGATTIELGPLVPDEIASLVEATLHLHPGPGLLKQTARAAGNPLFVLEMLDYMQQEGAIDVSEGLADVEDFGLTPPLTLTILRRLSFLPGETLEVLRMAAILGSSFSLADLAVVVDNRIDVIASLLEPALEAGVLTAAGARLSFRHELVREAIVEDIPEPVRVGLHLHVGRHLAAASAPASQVAAHFGLGAQPGDVVAIEWLRRAASEAAPRAPSIAIGLLERVLELQPDSTTRNEVEVELARALLWSGRFERAKQLTRQLLNRDGDAARGAGLAFALGRALVYEGRINESVEQVEWALRELELSPVERAQLTADTAMRRPLQGDLDGGETAALDALKWGEELGDRMVMGTSWSALSLIASMRGLFEEGVERARKAAIPGPREAKESVEEVQPRYFLGFALLEADRLQEGRDQFVTNMQIAERAGLPWALQLTHIALAFGDYLRGEWDDALTNVAVGVALGEELSMSNWLLQGLAASASISSHRGDAAAAREAIDRGWSLMQRLGPSQLGMDRFLWAASTTLDALEKDGEALTLLSGTWLFLEGLGITGRRRELGPDLVRLSVAAGDRTLALMVTDAVEEAAKWSNIPSVRGAALVCRGALERDSRPLLQAIDAYRSSGRVLELARAIEDTGLVLVAEGDASAGGRHLEEALGLFEGLAASYDSARVTRHLREFGIRRGRRGARKRPAFGWEALTRSEGQVAELAAMGLTNPQIGERLFVSKRTVATHLSHIFQKLGVRSRVELAAAIANRDTGREIAVPSTSVT
ncbi:MAG: hypothetical protein QOH90_879 [Actinomycetota bacterium]|nr:hypothetical protein [Actinomycetota bacterium]